MSRTNGRGASRAPWAAALAMAALTGLSACGKKAEAPAPAPAVEAPAPAAYAIGDLTVEHPWSRPAAAGMNGAGYLAVVNAGSEDDRLLSVATTAAQTVELHQMSTEGGVMSMSAIEGGVTVPAGGKIEFKPGAMHVMLIGLTAPLQAGSSFPATLVFEKAGRLDVAFTVEGAPPPAMDMNH